MYSYRKCQSVANVVNTEGYYHCTACENGPGLLKRAKRPQGDDRTEYDKLLDDQREQLKMASRIFSMDCAPNPNHEPAWKKRRRS